MQRNKNPHCANSTQGEIESDPILSLFYYTLHYGNEAEGQPHSFPFGWEGGPWTFSEIHLLYFFLAYTLRFVSHIFLISRKIDVLIKDIIYNGMQVNYNQGFVF